MSQPLDKDGQPLSRSFNKTRLQNRTLDELIGLCKGVLADGAVTQEEAEFLQEWLLANSQVADVWPANVLYDRISRMLADGTLDSDEEEELIQTLLEITGGPVLDPAVASMSTGLPLDDPPPVIIFQDQQFCLTGRFVYGSRRECESEVVARGGSAQKSPTLKTNYVVIGLAGSRDWIHSTHGRKIEAAVRLRDKGIPVRIVTEEHWVNSL